MEDYIIPSARFLLQFLGLVTGFLIRFLHVCITTKILSQRGKVSTMEQDERRDHYTKQCIQIFKLIISKVQLRLKLQILEVYRNGVSVVILLLACPYLDLFLFKRQNLCPTSIPQFPLGSPILNFGFSPLAQ